MLLTHLGTNIDDRFGTYCLQTLAISIAFFVHFIIFFPIRGLSVFLPLQLCCWTSSDPAIDGTFEKYWVNDIKVSYRRMICTYLHIRFTILLEAFPMVNRIWAGCFDYRSDLSKCLMSLLPLPSISIVGLIWLAKRVLQIKCACHMEKTGYTHVHSCLFLHVWTFVSFLHIPFQREMIVDIHIAFVD